MKKPLTCPKCSHRFPPPPNPLSPHQVRVANLILEAMTNKEIARLLGRGPDSIKQASSIIYAKTGVSSRSQFITKYFGTKFKEAANE